MSLFGPRPILFLFMFLFSHLCGVPRALDVFARGGGGGVTRAVLCSTRPRRAWPSGVLIFGAPAVCKGFSVSDGNKNIRLNDFEDDFRPPVYAPHSFRVHVPFGLSPGRYSARLPIPN